MFPILFCNLHNKICSYIYSTLWNTNIKRARARVCVVRLIAVNYINYHIVTTSSSHETKSHTFIVLIQRLSDASFICTCIAWNFTKCCVEIHINHTVYFLIRNTMQQLFSLSFYMNLKGVRSFKDDFLKQ